MGKKNKTSFNRNWLLEEAFLDWCRENEKDKFSAKCIKCNRSFSLSNMGRQALVSHMQGAKHRSACQNLAESYRIKTFFSTSSSATKLEDMTKPPADVMTQKQDNPVPEVGSRQTNFQRIKSFKQRDDVSKAEILWCLQSVVQHSSISGASTCTDVFKLMFPDSPIAQEMKLKRTKISYMITYGLGPYFHRQLVDDILPECPFSISFDESLNKISQKSQMDFVIRFWSKSKEKAVSMYMGSAFLSHTRAVDLLKSFKSELNMVDKNKLLQIAMDGPNVNLKFYRDFLLELNKENSNGLIDIGTCGLHVLHNSFKESMKATDWNLVPFLRSIYNLFKDVPARRADFIRLSKSDKFPLKFCSVRWLNNASVAERAIDLVPRLKVFVKGVKEEKIEPKCASYYTMVAALEDPLICAKLAFLQTLASEVEPILEAFQADKPMAPFLYTDYKNLTFIIMKRFVKLDVLENATDVRNIDVLDKENLLGVKYVKIGHATRDAVCKIKEVKEKDILEFRRSCLKALQTFCKKMKEKSPVAFKVAKYLSFCDPDVIKNSVTTATNRLSSLIQIFVSKGWISGITGDRIERQFAHICSNQGMKDVFKDYSRQDRLDKFWKEIISNFSASDLMSFLMMIFVLSHGQAKVERGFSINKECLVVNMSEKSLVAQRKVYEGVHTAAGILKVDITKSMIHYVRNSHGLYMEELESNKKKNEEEHKQEAKKRKAKEEICKLKEKKRTLESQMVNLDEDIRTLASSTI